MTSSVPSNQHRVALVTGASRGIGRAIAIELARIGCDVMINYVSNQSAAEDAREQAKSIAPEGTRVEISRADVSDASDRERLVEETKASFGRLDFLVNNAGIAPDKRVDLLNASEDSFDHLINVNLKGPYFLSQAVASLDDRAEENTLAMITHPRSSTSLQYLHSPRPLNDGDCCISKAGLAIVTKLYALRLADEGINVYEIRPGVIETDMTAKVKDKIRSNDRGWVNGRSRDGVARRRRRTRSSRDRIGAVCLFSTGEVINVDRRFSSQAFVRLCQRTYQPRSNTRFSFAQEQVSALVKRDPDFYPLYTDHGKWRHTKPAWTRWCDGFLPGMMWIFHRGNG